MLEHVVITGVPAVGKSTLVRRVLDVLNRKYALSTFARGFYTVEVRRHGGGDRIGFDVISLSGARGPLARVGRAPKANPTVGKYGVDLASFETLALAEMVVDAGTKLVVVDEIGKMELFSQLFSQAVENVFSSGALVFAVVPVAGRRPIAQIEAIKRRPDVDVVHLTRENRDKAVDRVCKKIMPQLDRLLAEESC